MLELTPEQQLAFARASGPIRLVDPETKKEFVLLPAESYDRLRALLSHDPEWADASYHAAMEVFARDGWDDPRMDVYDTLDPRRPS